MSSLRRLLLGRTSAAAEIFAAEEQPEKCVCDPSAYISLRKCDGHQKAGEAKQQGPHDTRMGLSLAISDREVAGYDMHVLYNKHAGSRKTLPHTANNPRTPRQPPRKMTYTGAYVPSVNLNHVSVSRFLSPFERILLTRFRCVCMCVCVCSARDTRQNLWKNFKQH